MPEFICSFIRAFFQRPFQSDREIFSSICCSRDDSCRSNGNGRRASDHRCRFSGNRICILLLFLAGLCCLLLCLVPGALRKASAGSDFADLTDEIFRTEVTSSTLTLHYTLLSPEDWGISDYAVSYDSADSSESINQILRWQDALSEISYSDLSLSNRQTYDVLALTLQESMESADWPYYDEPLGAAIGIQAQLPVLLAEYAFTSVEDIHTYLKLLTVTDTYFASLLAYEREKSAAGLFMSDTNADAILEQCSSFLEGDPEEHFLVTSFNEKIREFSGLSESERSELQKENLEAVTEHVFPAYQLLIQGLTALKGTGKNENGLCYFPGGTSYYEHLLREQTGSWLSVDTIQNRIQQQLQTDVEDCRQLLQDWPAAADAALPVSSFSTPEAILEDLQNRMQADFPAAPQTAYLVNEVPDSLAPYLSPAFYLTSPIDCPDQNIIYINPASSLSDLELYTTLAHEGYPGHLYQTLYSGQTLSPLRSLLSFGGYTEGWATYVEMISYGYAAENGTEEQAAAAALQQKNRSFLLGLSSLLDICIHYRGYTRSDVRTYLSELGFVNTTAADSLFDAIIESPGNYLKYYLGYLSFLDLRTWCETKWPDTFTLSDFHRRVLEIGPCQFPVLEKYLEISYSSS